MDLLKVLPDFLQVLKLIVVRLELLLKRNIFLKVSLISVCATLKGLVDKKVKITALYITLRLHQTVRDGTGLKGYGMYFSTQGRDKCNIFPGSPFLMFWTMDVVNGTLRFKQAKCT